MQLKQINMLHVFRGLDYFFTRILLGPTHILKLQEQDSTVLRIPLAIPEMLRSWLYRAGWGCGRQGFHPDLTIVYGHWNHLLTLLGISFPTQMDGVERGGNLPSLVDPLSPHPRKAYFPNHDPGRGK